MFQSRKRNRDGRSRPNTANLHYSKPSPDAKRLAVGRPYLSVCPKLPPKIATITNVTRTVELIVVGTKDRGSQYPEILYGNAGTPCYAKIDVTDNNRSTEFGNCRFEFGLTYSDLCKMLASRFVRSAVTKTQPEAQILANDIFSYVKLERVRAWGPTGADLIGFPIQLTVYNLSCNVLKSGTYSVLGVCSERAIGDRANRAAISIDVPSIFVPVALDFEIAPKMHVVQIVIGWNVYDGGTAYKSIVNDGDILAVLHLTVSAQCGRDTTATLSTKVYNDVETSTSCSGFSMLD